MNITSEIQTAHMRIDAILQELSRKVQQYEQAVSEYENTDNRPQNYESIRLLTNNPKIFKGEKPTGVLFGETERVDVYTWKMLFKEILKRCNDDPEKHVALMNLRGKVSGRERMLLSKNSDGMRSPHKIADNLFIETHYDTESLLHILTKRILDAVGYDYSHISVAIRNNL
ncbi:MAG: hypothetical protein FWE20_03020 [Defluviitaleaceae bacterium]|nr:hypothetical protein [Defluviitaleaceae bacterium]